MSEATALLRELRRRGIELSVVGEELRYRAPEGTLTPEFAALLRQHKAELMRHLACNRHDSFRRVPDAPHHEVSHAQRRIWVLSQMGTASVAYNIPMRFQVEGYLERDALENAMSGLVARHEALRSTFKMVGGDLRQVVHPPMTVIIREFDLSGEHQPEAALRSFARTEAVEPFDLEYGPLLRVCLVRLGPSRHVLLFTIHHIVCDGWSLRVIMKDLRALYEAAFSRGNASLPPLKIQFRDYAAWQNRLLDSDEMRLQSDYWLSKFAGKLLPLDLPLDAPRQLLQTFKGRTFTLRFDADDSRRIRDYARSRQCSVFIFHLAVIKVLLFRYSGQTDLVVGTAVAGRNRTEFEDQVGCYLNTLALRDILEPHGSFDSFLRRVRQTTLEALDHQDYPFDHLIDALKLSRELSRSALFDVMVVNQSADELDYMMGSSRVSHVPQEVQTSKLDLHFDCEEGEHFLQIGIEYNPDLFFRERVERMACHLRELVASILADPTQPVDHLNLLPDRERQHLLVDLNRTAMDWSDHRTLVEMFEAQAAATPDAVAADCGDASLTYRELNCRGNQLARHLKRLGVGPEEVVGICTGRSLEMLFGLIGILKAGGAYVPLDPSYPEERLNYMIADSGLSVLLTQASLNLPFSAPHIHKVFLDTDWAMVAEESTENLEWAIGAGNLAYVIYTSGSTGRPKGVQVPHRGVSNFLRSLRTEPGISGNDVLLAVTTICFDISVLELFLPLLSGARVVMVSREVASDGVLLLRAMLSSGATVMQATPATWRMVLAAGWEGPSGLKILCGGEAVPCDLASQLLERGASVWNLYGPTETTIWSTVGRVQAASKTVPVEPIGRPIANTQAHILDACLQPVPLGIAGDLYIGGAGVARGYRNRPDLTAERFIPNRFATSVGDRLYKTGDVARYLADGTIEFLGRFDHQVKVRGYRIELGEVEAALTTHPAVREVVVVARENEPGERQLVAHVVPQENATFQAAEMRRHLADKLPDYMIPSACVLLSALPLTPNGKVDRLSLPAAGAGPAELVCRYAAPRDETEAALATIWQEVLNIRQIGIHDDFFELGGHSLKAARIISRARQQHKMSLTLLDVFRFRTVARLAEFARGNPDDAAEAIAVLESALPAAVHRETAQPMTAEELELLND